MAELWQPDPASIDLEEKMESAGLPESDRDEVRRLVEFLRRHQKHLAGETLEPAPAGMLEWLKGEDQP